MGKPWWHEAFPDFRFLSTSELPPGSVSGYFFTTPVVDMSVYLEPYLRCRLESGGGSLLCRDVTGWEEPLAFARLVVNCTGIGARSLTHDEGLFPDVRQIHACGRKASSRPGFFLPRISSEGPVWVVRRSTDWVLGTERGDDRCSLVDSRASALIQNRCARFFPELTKARLPEARVGIRPGRASVRLEAECFGVSKTIIHHYGHGAAGLTLSWGSARAVLALLRAWG